MYVITMISPGLRRVGKVLSGLKITGALWRRGVYNLVDVEVVAVPGKERDKPIGDRHIADIHPLPAIVRTIRAMTLAGGKRSDPDFGYFGMVGYAQDDA